VLRRVLALAGAVAPIGDPPTTGGIGSGVHLGPQESGKLSGHGDHGHALDVLAPLQLPEPAAKPQLRRPRTRQCLGRDLLALAEGAGDEGAVVVGPGRFHQLETEMLAAGAGSTYAYVSRPGSLPGATWAAWYQQQWWIPMLALVFVATPLLFPTGRLLSARWRPVAALAALVTVALVLLAALQPTIKLQDQNYWVYNPIGLAATPDPETSTIAGVLLGLLTCCIVAAVICLVLRFRRSRGGAASAAQVVRLRRGPAAPDDPGGDIPAGPDR
jgi:hypothetical protein